MKKLLLITLCIFFFQIIKAQDEFITIWKPGNTSAQNISGGVTSTSTQIWFPGRGNNFNVSWEEVGHPSHNGSLSNITSTLHFLIDFGNPQNAVAANATYRVKVSNGNGTFKRVKFYDALTSVFFGDPDKILKIEHWGNIIWENMDFAYSSCSNLDMTATDTPNLTNVISFDNIFNSCASLIGNSSFNNWDTSNVTDLQAAFSNCPLFNQPLGNWDTSNVTRMILTFALATSFNQNINSWDTGNVQSFNAMFFNAHAFNQPLGDWDMSSAIEIELMFSGALAFNKPIGNWNTANVSDFQRTFLNAHSFNQPIGNWDTSNGIYMQGMFQNATAFNQDIKNWNTSNVTLMTSMFQNATSFNQNIGDWNTDQVTTMDHMFNGATNFNQNLGSWNLSSLTSASNLFLNSGLNCQNYDSTLLGWSTNSLTPQNISISNISPLKYSHQAAVNARNFLITSKGWSITGDSYDGECQSVLSTSENIIKKDISIYPNPATDFIFIKNFPKEAKEYQIIDFSGRVITKDLLNQEMINVQHLVPGNYILKIRMGDKTENFKFIKK